MVAGSGPPDGCSDVRSTGHDWSRCRWGTSETLLLSTWKRATVTDKESDKRPDVTQAVTAVWSAIIRSVSGLAGARNKSAAALQLVGCGRRVVDDVSLIMTELAVNAFEHGQADHVEVRIDVADDGNIEIRVSHEEDFTELDVAEEPVMAAADALAGRGRAIVAGLTSRFETDRLPPNRIEQLAVVAP